MKTTLTVTFAALVAMYALPARAEKTATVRAAENNAGHKHYTAETDQLNYADCAPCVPCCPEFWEHRTGIFADFLYLRPRGVDVAYAQIRDGVDPLTSVPTGRTATASPDYSPGVRGGFNWALDRTSSLTATYTYFQSETNDALTTAAPLVIHSFATHPGTASAAADSLAAEARYDIRFQLADVDYRRLLAGGRNYAVNYSLGVRYGHLDQYFRTAQPISPGTTGVATDINFDGVGARLGLAGERKAANRGWLMYARTNASVMVGTFHSDYNQFNTFSLLQSTTTWADSRAVPMLEYELGGGWQNAKGTVRLTAGYYFAAWFNTVTTPQFLNAARTSNFVDVRDTITFDGLTARLELRR